MEWIFTYLKLKNKSLPSTIARMTASVPEGRARKYDYLVEEKNIYLIGIDFDLDKKNIASFEWEQVR